ncbi:hypothetical protein Tco_1280251 [Tanacetum coccineum]
MSTPKPKENLEPNPHQLLIQEEKFKALENPTGSADHFVYRIDIVDTLYDKFPIRNKSLSGNPTPSFNSMVKSFSLLPTPFEDSDSLVEETDTLLSYFNDSSPDYETFCFDIEEKSSGSTTTYSDFLFLNMNRLSLIFRLIRFLLPIGEFLIKRSSPMNSLTSYLHRSMTVFTLILRSF